MPEMPEVQAFSYYLKHTSLNKKIIDIYAVNKQIIEKSTFASFKNVLKGKKFTTAKTEGKYLIISISNTSKKIVIHFGLTGSLAYEKDGNKKVKYSRVTFLFSDHSALHWIDIRKFGHIWLVNTLSDITSIKHLGKNPLKITQKNFKDLVKKHKSKNVKSFLMDQSMLAGIGNEYSDEILFQAGIDPHHNLKDLSENQIKKIYEKMKSILIYAISLCKKNVNEITGDQAHLTKDTMFKNSYLQAHRHGDKKCPKNKNHNLRKAIIAGRSSYYCPYDQK